VKIFNLTKLAKKPIIAIFFNKEIIMQITATELKNRLGQYLDAAETSPVIVEKSGRIKSVLISNAMYEKFLAYEDAYWASKANVAEEGGYLGEKASEALIAGN
jgi:antitoxin Phd